jgi:antirestriction protein ArdC
MAEIKTNSDKRQQVKELTDKLEQGIKDIFDSEKFASYLKTMSAFHKYSTRNIILIYWQNPYASKVAGYQAWQTKFGRYVKQGEKGIKILAPTPFTIKREQQKLDPDTKMPIYGENGLPETEEVEVRIPRFKVTSVFDVSQTDGKPLPQLAEDLPGDVRHYELFFDTLKAISPLPIVFEPLQENLDGLCRLGNNIAIREGMSEIQTISAAIHEITHSKLHDVSVSNGNEESKPKDKTTEEIEAEGVSYAVCQYYGVETGANSFGYLASWIEKRESSELTNSLETIRSATSEFIDSIDAKFRELAKSRGIDLTAETDTPIIETVVKTDVISDKMTEKARSLIDIAESDKPCFGDGEKNLILNYAAHTDNIRKIMNLVNELAEARHELTNGIVDSAVAERVNAEINVAELKNNPEPEQEKPEVVPLEMPEIPEIPEEINADDMPDSEISFSGCSLYGYANNEMFPLTKDRALELFDQDHTIYLLYPDDTEAMAFEREEIENFDGIFGIEREEWEKRLDFKTTSTAVDNSEGSLEAEFFYGNDNMFGIYQLKLAEELRNYRFISFEQIEKSGLNVDRANYELVYTAPLNADDTPDSIFVKYNCDIPADYTARSLSMSDIIVFQRGGTITSLYISDTDFVELPAFLGEEKKLETVRDESIPTVAELEAEVKAGRQISLLDLAHAVHNEPPQMQNSRRRKPQSKAKKESILDRVYDYKKAQVYKENLQKKEKERE